MPELPEMETYKKLLGERIVGKTIAEVTINREKSINVAPEQFTKELGNAHIIAINRRAKHLIFKLSNGKSLLLHLMLGGWMYLGDEEDNPERTKQVILTFGPISLYFIGLRLGYLHLLTETELEKELSDLGPEPLDMQFSLPKFNELLDSRRGMLKTTLVNQQFISGIGNCYSDEICYEAKLQPGKKIDTLTQEMRQELYNGMQSALRRALKFGGYMDQPLYKGDNLTGGYNEHCYVYDREGETCNRCGGTIVKEELSSRKTFYCPNCQRE
ncbi:DNA-formamidopyrimidine glycosylase family protein [Bacillus sp. 31A1R]|uniref:Formamidopyrimidine-DNA glycosylase n=1 Tax=Robertmurraya mangrovi TaxID=3098077 RepID=A0ABU5J3T4_9BACI|nr:DNA-formamidopyrimidine glycosylase family protein [Bacillus sp. 31A1R]MDZ5474025.1 DNA-formamidopyrimidine glycosylase family protein [Bacillus sp. 31A1R]